MIKYSCFLRNLCNLRRRRQRDAAARRLLLRLGEHDPAARQVRRQEGRQGQQGIRTKVGKDVTIGYNDSSLSDNRLQ